MILVLSFDFEVKRLQLRYSPVQHFPFSDQPVHGPVGCVTDFGNIFPSPSSGCALPGRTKRKSRALVNPAFKKKFSVLSISASAEFDLTLFRTGIEFDFDLVIL